MNKRIRIKLFKTLEDGLCFYHSIAKGIQNIFGIKIDGKYLLNLCSQFLKNNNDRWINNYFNYIKVNKNNYIDKMSKGEIWGDPYLDGKIITKIYNIKILLIEKIKIDKKNIYLLNLISKNSSKSYSNFQNFYLEHSNDQSIISCYNGNNNHFEYAIFSME